MGVLPRTHTYAPEAQAVASVPERQLMRASCRVGGVVKWICRVLKRYLNISISQHFLFQKY